VGSTQRTVNAAPLIRAPTALHTMPRVLRRRRELDNLRGRVAQLERELDDARLDPGLWVARRVSDELGLTVRSGPFTGLRYVERAVGAPHLADCLPAKLLGSYERELHPAIERAMRTGFSTIVNVGAADGYYAVGLALRMPEARVFAFEVNEGRRDLCMELARLNGVAERIDIAGACDPAWLAALEGDCLLVMDCEGCEVGLLGREQAASLAGSSLIVELHDFIDPRSSHTVVERFSATHECERIAAAPRHSGDFPELEFLGWKNRELAISEVRTHPMEWAVLTPMER
jgi:precorrin-6B methylase 2